MPHALDIAHLTHTYARAAQPALDDVSLSINEGELFAILGPNGGGKTTLFRILTTVLRPPGSAADVNRPDTHVRLFECDALAQPAAARRHLGVVFQHPSLDDKLTVRENLKHHGRLHGLTGRELRERIAHWLERFGLTEKARTLVEKLSGGQQRRVEIAKAMLHRPRLLLLDEPSTGLDVGARRDLWHTLDALRREHGITVVLTTHLMDEADRCDRVAILHQGKLVALDAPGQLKRSIGGDVVTLDLNFGASTPDESSTPHALVSDIQQSHGDLLLDAAAPPRVVDGKLHLEARDGAAAVAALSTAYAGRYRSISVGPPTLEDVFLHRTGYRFAAP